MTKTFLDANLRDCVWKMFSYSESVTEANLAGLSGIAGYVSDTTGIEKLLSISVLNLSEN